MSVVGSFKKGSDVRKPWGRNFRDDRWKLGAVQRLSLLVGSFLSGCVAAAGQTRPPAAPLITHNPYFSIWSMGDHLTDENTKHWTGAEQPLTGLVRIDGQSYRFLGARPQRSPVLRQRLQEVTPTHTRYQFEGGGIGLELTFFTPALPEDINVLSRPVTYVTWNIHATDGVGHDVDVYLDIDPRIAVNSADQQVVWGRSRARGLTVLNVGSRDQEVLNRSGDDLRIDWGYFHLAVPDTESAETAQSPSALDDFLENGTPRR